MKKTKRKKSISNSVLHILSILLFALYLVLLVWLVSFKCNLKITITDTYYVFGAMTWEEKLQFVKQSFLALPEYDKWATVFNDTRQAILNVVAFVPLGIYLRYFAKMRKLFMTAVTTVMISLMFECVQLVSNIGCFESMDVVTNALGGLIGYLIYKLIYKNNPKRIKILIIASFIALTILVPLAFYAVDKTVNMFDFYLDILLKRL